MTFQQIYDANIPDDIYVQYVDILKPYLDDSKRIIDIGCGTGKLLSLLRPYTEYLYGIDLDFDMIQTAKKNFSRINFIQHDMHDPLPYFADIAILSMDVIHFSENPEHVLSNVINALEQEGIIIFDYFSSPIENVFEIHQMPFPYTWKRTIEGDIIHHVVNFNNEEINLKQFMHLNFDFVRYLEANAFEISRIQSIDPNKTIIFAKR
jgi:SAM-dependent methyltransferase